ncbi:MAG: FIST C-terminal domain-containing protein [Labilithrix sp.]|nr:FIST C-terminal domain-containing protein [Labilithrix sp.]MCW5833783.1 FIST C-terminal domain-containing protein [Labilithrix sp.]
MLIFGSGMSAEASAEAASRAAAAQAREAFGGRPPKIALVFGSGSYPDLAAAPRAVREVVGDVPVVGGSSGARVLGPRGIAARGVSVVLLGGDDVEVAERVVELGGPELVEVVPAAREIARAADDAASRGLEHCVCLAFAPVFRVDGEALVAAIRKGAGPRAQLAGGLTGEPTTDRPGIFVGDELRGGHALLAGLFTRKRAGISARHGLRVVGPPRTVTRAEGQILHELDGRPAADVWLEDARRAGATPPKALNELAAYLADRYELGIADTGNRGREGGELVARAPWEVQPDGSVKLSASIGEGRHVQILHAGRKDLLRASTNAAAEAVLRVDGPVAGALVLSCTGRIATLGEEFTEEAALIRDRVGAPIGGACVYGEIAKSERDVDAFFNTTAVIVAFGA